VLKRTLNYTLQVHILAWKERNNLHSDYISLGRDYASRICTGAIGVVTVS
jgi:hypothetical protein